MMEQQAPNTTDFQKRRNQKNWIVMALVLGGAALVWLITLVKLQNGG